MLKHEHANSINRRADFVFFIFIIIIIAIVRSTSLGRAFV